MSARCGCGDPERKCGEVAHVNNSEATYELVKNETGHTFTPRGKMKAMGKGEMEMYFVHRSTQEAPPNGVLSEHA